MNSPPPKKWAVKLDHPSWSLPADHCPKCDYPEAEGGWCANCGWSLPKPRRKE